MQLDLILIGGLLISYHFFKTTTIYHLKKKFYQADYIFWENIVSEKLKIISIGLFLE
jgi:hypothetical protein